MKAGIRIPIFVACLAFIVGMLAAASSQSLSGAVSISADKNATASCVETSKVGIKGFAREDFCCRLMQRTAACVFIGGLYKSIKEQDLELIRRLSNLPGARAEDVVNVVVKSIRRAAESTDGISTNCMSSLSKRSIITADCRFHPSEVPQHRFAPHYVSELIAIRDVEFWKGKGPPPWWKS